MTRLGLLLTALSFAVLLALPSAVAASSRDDPVLNGTVGTAGAPDAFSIRLTDAGGNPVNRVPAGEYQLHVVDYSTIHDFHFFGPGGVDQHTDIETTSDVTWTVTLVDGTYSFQCDAHPLALHGILNVGAPPPPPPPPTRLTAKVSASGVVTLKKGGKAVASLPAGRYTIAVADGSAKENFHLTGPGVNAKTTLAFKGARTLKVTLRKGTYRYRSDAHPKLARSVKVSAPPTP